MISKRWVIFKYDYITLKPTIIQSHDSKRHAESALTALLERMNVSGYTGEYWIQELSEVRKDV